MQVKNYNKKFKELKNMKMNKKTIFLFQNNNKGERIKCKF